MRGRGIFGLLLRLLRLLLRGGRRRPRAVAGRRAKPKTYSRRTRRG